MGRAFRQGHCHLTHVEGPLVRCHLLPQALTRTRATKGRYFIEAGGGVNAIGRRWNSWYDDELVTAAGESILSRIDDRGVKILRRARLVWSGWDANQDRLDAEVESNGSVRLRRVSGVDGPELRRFLLSLLWRAAATSRPEFSEIEVPEADLEVLRSAIVSGSLPPPEFYPATLLQYVTRFDDHNRSPIRWPGPAGPISPKFKFYMDGMAALFFGGHTDPVSFGPLIVSAESDLLVSTFEFEGSEQHRNLLLAAQEAWWQGVRG